MVAPSLQSPLEKSGKEMSTLHNMQTVDELTIMLLVNNSCPWSTILEKNLNRVLEG